MVTLAGVAIVVKVAEAGVGEVGCLLELPVSEVDEGRVDN
jgi:hypothetical protein